MLKFPPQATEAGLEPRRLQQPVHAEGFGQGQAVAQLAAAVDAALPEIGAGGEQVDLHIDHAAEGLQQAHLNRRHAAEAEQPHPLRQLLRCQPLGCLLVPQQALDRRFHLDAEGIAVQALGQGAVQRGLPVLARRQGPAAVIDGFPACPGPQHGGAIEAVVVEGIGDGAAQLPGVPFQALLRGEAIQPGPQRRPTGSGRHHGQQLQQRPHQHVGPPWIDGRKRWRAAGHGGVRTGLWAELEHRLDQLAQVGTRKGIAQVGGDAAQVLSQLFPQPATGGPGVDHHLHRFEGVGRTDLQLGGQDLGQQLGPVAAVDDQHGVPLRGNGAVSTGGAVRRPAMDQPLVGRPWMDQPVVGQ